MKLFDRKKKKRHEVKTSQTGSEIITDDQNGHAKVVNDTAVKLRRKNSCVEKAQRPTSTASIKSNSRPRSRPWSFLESFRRQNSKGEDYSYSPVLDDIHVPQEMGFHTFDQQTAENAAEYLKQKQRSRKSSFALFKYLRRTTTKQHKEQYQNQINVSKTIQKIEFEQVSKVNITETQETASPEPMINESVVDGRAVLQESCSLDAEPEVTSICASSYDSNESTKLSEALLEEIAAPVVLRRKKNNSLTFSCNEVQQRRPMSAYIAGRDHSASTLNLQQQILKVSNTLSTSHCCLDTFNNCGNCPPQRHHRLRSSTSYTKMKSSKRGLHVAASLDNFDLLDEDEKLNVLLGAKSHLSQDSNKNRGKTLRNSVASIANFITPRGKLQRSTSFKESTTTTTSSTPTITVKPYRPTPLKQKNRDSKLWCKTFDSANLNEDRIKWQESIYEWFQLERDYLEDLTTAIQTYRDSMVTLKLMSEENANAVFRNIDSLLPLHSRLLQDLICARDENGCTSAVGYIWLEWLPQIAEAYRVYCSKQAAAISTLKNTIEKDARLRDFLERCFESPFAMKRSLESFLDTIRTRVLKYSLILQNILKRTPAELKQEIEDLKKAMAIASEIGCKIEETYAEQECQYVRSKLEYIYDNTPHVELIERSKIVFLEAEIKSNRGTKLMGLVFDQAVVLTHAVTRGDSNKYQVTKDPLPMRSLFLDENCDAVKPGGSFRGGSTRYEQLKHAFRLHSHEIGKSFTLQAADEYDKRKWILALRNAMKRNIKKNLDWSNSASEINSHPLPRCLTYDVSDSYKKTLSLSNVQEQQQNNPAMEEVHGLSCSGRDTSLIITSTEEDLGLVWSSAKISANKTTLSVSDEPESKRPNSFVQCDHSAQPEKETARKRNSAPGSLINIDRTIESKINSRPTTPRHVFVKRTSSSSIPPVAEITPEETNVEVNHLNNNNEKPGFEIVSQKCNINRIMTDDEKSWDRFI